MPCKTYLCQISGEFPCLLEATNTKANTILGAHERHILAMLLPKIQRLRLLLIAHHLELIDALLDHPEGVQALVIEARGRLGPAVRRQQNAPSPDVSDTHGQDGVDQLHIQGQRVILGAQDVAVGHRGVELEAQLGLLGLVQVGHELNVARVDATEAPGRQRVPHTSAQTTVLVRSDEDIARAGHPCCRRSLAAFRHCHNVIINVGIPVIIENSYLL